MRVSIVKVGNDEHPATQEDIDDMKRQITEFERQYGLHWPVFVTHHAVYFDTIELPHKDDVDTYTVCEG